MNLIKIASLFLILILVSNFVFLVLGMIRPAIFWLVIIIIGFGTWMIKKNKIN